MMRREWLFVVAGLAFLALAVLALHTSNALYFSIGTLAAIAILAPWWWQRPRYLLFGLVLLFVIQDGFLDPLTKGVTLARVLPDIVLLLAFLGRLTLAWQRKERIFATGLEAPLVFILAVAAVSLLINHIAVTQAVQGPYTMLRYALVFYLAAASQFRVAEIVAFVRMLVGLVVIESLIGVVQFAQLHLTGNENFFGSHAVNGTMLHFNILGVFLALVALIVLIAYTPVTRHYGQIEVSIILGLAMFTIMLATSRQSIAAFVLGVLTMLVVSRQNIHLAQQWKPAAIIGGVIVVGILAGVLAQKLPYSKLAQASPTTADAATIVQQKINGGELNLSTNFYENPRFYAISHAGGTILRQSPLFGKGPGTYGSQPTFNNTAFYNNLHVGLLMSVPGATLVADVEWLSVFGQLGLLGLAGFLWLFFSIGRIGYRVWRQSQDDVTRRLGLLTVAIVPVFLLLGLFGPNFETRQLSIFLWLIPALALSLFRQEQAAPPTVSSERQTVERDPALDETLKRFGMPKIHA